MTTLMLEKLEGPKITFLVGLVTVEDVKSIVKLLPYDTAKFSTFTDVMTLPTLVKPALAKFVVSDP